MRFEETPFGTKIVGLKEAINAIGREGMMEYQPACYQCRADAGKDPAGVKETSMCVPHMKQHCADLTRQLSETNNLWADLGRKNNELKEQIAAAKVYNERWIERCRAFRKQDADKAEVELAEAREEIARLRKALQNIAMQHLESEMAEEADVDGADYRGAYDCIVKVARAELEASDET